MPPTEGKERKERWGQKRVAKDGFEIRWGWGHIHSEKRDIHLTSRVINIVFVCGLSKRRLLLSTLRFFLHVCLPQKAHNDASGKVRSSHIRGERKDYSGCSTLKQRTSSVHVFLFSVHAWEGRNELGACLGQERASEKLFNWVWRSRQPSSSFAMFTSDIHFVFELATPAKTEWAGGDIHAIQEERQADM